MATTSANRWMKIGALFQFPMIGFFIAETQLFKAEHPAPAPLALQLLDYAGSLLFMCCLYQLYIVGRRTSGLITSGPFRYTRHPMYLGMLIMNLACCAHASTWSSPLFVVIETLFLTTMVAAGYCQERETLERFGAEAEEYYKRTPRIPFTPC